MCRLAFQVSLPDGPTVKAPARWIPMKNHQSFEKVRSTLPGKSFDGHGLVLREKNVSIKKRLETFFFENEEHVKIHTHIDTCSMWFCIFLDAYSIGIHSYSYFDCRLFGLYPSDSIIRVPSGQIIWSLSMIRLPSWKRRNSSCIPLRTRRGPRGNHVYPVSPWRATVRSQGWCLLLFEEPKNHQILKITG